MLKSVSIGAFDPSRPWNEAFKMAKEHGFEGVEVVVGEDGPLTTGSSQADCRRIREQAEAAGIRLVSLAGSLGWKYRLTSADAALRTEAVTVTRACLRLAAALGTDALLVVPGGVGAPFKAGFPVTPYQAAYDNTLTSLGELKTVAEENGVVLGIENVWNMFLLSPLEMRGLVDAAGSDEVGVYLDVANILSTGYPEDWIRILGQRIKRVHFKDFKRDVGTAKGFCPLLEGDVNYPEVMKALREIGYQGPVVAEYTRAESDLAAISAQMDRILAM